MKIALVYKSPLACQGVDHVALRQSESGSEVPPALTMIQTVLAADREVVLMTMDSQLEEKLLAEWPDLVLHLADDFGCSEASVAFASMLERWHIPYAGSSARTIRLCQDRGATRRLLDKHGMPTPVFTVAQTADDLRGITYFPVSIKPLLRADSSLHEDEIIAYTRQDMRATVRWIIEAYDQPALVETLLQGREFTVAILGNGPQPTTFSLVERYATTAAVGIPANPARKQSGAKPDRVRPHPTFICPASVSSDLQAQMTKLAQKTFLTLECQDFCSVHLCLDDEQQPYIMAVNPLPGLLPRAGHSSAFLQAASAAGMTYPALIARILQLTSRRHGFAA